MHELANQNSNLKIQHVKQHGAQEHFNLDSKVENSLWIIGGAFKDFFYGKGPCSYPRTQSGENCEHLSCETKLLPINLNINIANLITIKQRSIDGLKICELHGGMAVPSVDLEIEEKEEEITNADPSSDLVAPILGTQVGTTTGGLCKSKPGNWHAEMATAICVGQKRPVQHREFLISKHPNFLYRASAPPYPQSETMHIATGFLEADAPRFSSQGWAAATG